LNPILSRFSKVSVFSVFLAALGMVGQTLWAQDADAAAKQQAIQEKVAALKESIAKNQAALKLYSWTETTEISLKGEVKKREQKACRYGPDGKVQKTAIPGSEQAQEKPEQDGGKRGRRGGGAVKKAVIDKKVGDIKEYMQQTAALVKEYVPPDPAKIQAAVKAGKVSPDKGAEGALATLTFSDYVKPEDRLKLGFDPAAKKLKTYNVDSYLEKPDEPVTLAVRFDSLPDGTNYPKEIVLDASKENIVVKITNSGYTKIQP
jgi:hypothetical protein